MGCRASRRAGCGADARVKYRVEIDPHARRTFRRLPSQAQVRILRGLHGLNARSGAQLDAPDRFCTQPVLRARAERRAVALLPAEQRLPGLRTNQAIHG